MIDRIVSELGPWNWMVLGFVLLVVEVIAPGFFMLWIGIAALIVGAVSLLIWDAAIWTWQVQVLLFLVLSLVSAFVGKKLMGGRDQPTDQPLLNRRGAQMIGRMATLAEPIRDGRGRIKLGDTLWRVSGPDLPAGTQVRVTAAADTDLELTVEQV
ncbi:MULTISPECIES: NfeD family protein [unclassified Mesorhizobium]|uniref:NfeD family protein n=1 Tax=unclassified Mesorhizobium TaxID=325217 RepID=UPI000FCC12BF|nr:MULTISPECIES: NfeD family protein [unclassified Mesorhizobium]RUW87351.1 NfeD family protein [Mesorhizobium sp. M8A.F.Ca.ET.023.01.1.1]RUX01847.1 NfeD family protein [Mesorhizobium sp. M8A.F.Ca.ET.059.01.1.1]RVD51643.1 NfeD family protein [Mesorhizobium sp. M8A.F.Ca.ET.023.02.2.1]TGR48718.1 NfeD family protein [bacterium M00.F.Ca.ET.199.01.1.1]TGU37759.1 NfeD family protein [bacterium M00.F.Ca.ET.156.01.1.1]TGU96855.1 NfeD family protein [Mesorhizobium sp. M00.F.Ca.ET.151.01.1.1]TGV14573.